MLDFPAPVTSGTVFTAPNGLSWQYDGAKWIQVPSAGQGPFVPDVANDGQYYTRQNGLWVPNNAVAQGFTNRLRNGTFDIWQRATPITCAINVNTYTADGWYGNATGVAITAQNVTGRGPTINSLQLTGAASNTGSFCGQRIEGYVAETLGGNLPNTFQCWIFNNTGATLTPALDIQHPSARDNYATVITDFSAVPLQPCPVGAWTRVAYTFVPPAGNVYQNGMVTQLRFGPLLASQTIQVSEADVRVTPGLPVGLCANPPPPELRHIQAEWAFCCRYFQNYTGLLVYQLNAAAGGSVINDFVYPVPFRVAPTITYTGVAYSNSSGIATNSANNEHIRVSCVCTAAGTSYVTFGINAVAEL